MRYIVKPNSIDKFWPTHLHQDKFWEALGRAVATFGFLEEILGKAIFAFTATRTYTESEIDTAYQEWLDKLEIAITGQLNKLIDIYSKAVREHQSPAIH